MTTKQFYMYSETACVYVIERSWGVQIVGSFLPLEDEPKEPDNYDYTTELNEWNGSKHKTISRY